MNRHPLARRTLLAFAAASCAFPAVATAQSAGRGKALRIGTTFDNTGIGRVNGADLFAGSRALIARVNREGGIQGVPLELAMEDDGFDPAVTKQKTEAFVADPSILALLHPLGTQQTAAMMQVTTELAVVGPSTGTIGLRRSKAPNVFWTRASYGDEMDRLLGMASTLELRSAALVYPNDALGQSLLAAFQASCDKHKLKAVATSATPNTASVEVEPAARVIAQANPQLVVMGLAASSPAFVLAFRRLNASTRIFGISIGASSGSIRAMGDMARGVGFSIVVPSPTAQKFELVRRYQADLKAIGSTDYSLFGVEGYLAASVLVQALRRAGPGATRASVVQALEEISGLDLGGVRVSFGRGLREGSDFVSVAVVGPEGRLTM
ncbi:ABC transporter substrate-binding protein [Caenimonas sedimenti]|uniref:ABC transporter substrate-binding protein n=1 Tax=Caenimonas sedimenti TaxID=2596921 RepID=A0A562ZX87_9BURK|nr:ABC transporter substrate-binding protein [Caenimonas sedimenti]TWO72938.1 ABC transporter substrate-binding protein [Caenimonas sedimenti]